MEVEESSVPQARPTAKRPTEEDYHLHEHAHSHSALPAPLGLPLHGIKKQRLDDNESRKSEESTAYAEDEDRATPLLGAGAASNGAMATDLQSLGSDQDPASASEPQMSKLQMSQKIVEQNIVMRKEVAHLKRRDVFLYQNRAFPRLKPTPSLAPGLLDLILIIHVFSFDSQATSSPSSSAPTTKSTSSPRTRMSLQAKSSPSNRLQNNRAA